MPAPGAQLPEQALHGSQLSGPQLVPAAVLPFLQPVGGSHESFVQGLPSLQFRAPPPPQLPPAQRSLIVHAFPSLHVAVLFVFTQPVDGLHESFVHTLPSLQFRGLPAPQLPPEHWSPTVQALPSLHVAVLFAFTQPVDGLHESLVHTLPSSQFRGLPAPQLPPEHWSPTVQALPSLHDAVLLVFTQPVAPQLSLVHGFPSSQPAGAQLPPQQISAPPQRFVRTQRSPSQLAVWHGPAVQFDGVQTGYWQPMAASHVPPGSAVHRPSSATTAQESASSSQLSTVHVLKSSHERSVQTHSPPSSQPSTVHALPSSQGVA